MKTIYQCEICGSMHTTTEGALACEATPMRDMKNGGFIDGANAHEPEVGEVVECCYPAYSWRKGDPDWSVWRERGGRFLDGYYNLWVVVAKITPGDRHEWHYILWSPSTITGHEHICWTSPGHHQMWANRKATEAEMAAALAAFDAFKNKQRIPLM